MNKLCILAASSLAFAMAPVFADTHWSYSTEYGHGGPLEWAGLTTDNVMCAGKNQTPIDLDHFTEARLPAIAIRYGANGNELWNNGHTLQVNFLSGSGIEVDGKAFALKQFHFHAPSENWIKGKSFPMEMHLVHADESGNLAVIAVMFSEGEKNAALERLTALMPVAKDQKKPISPSFDAATLLPENRSYYRFSGSLTTPPCSEGVRWLVMKTPLNASVEQIEAFSRNMHSPNNRPLQKANGRPILQ